MASPALFAGATCSLAFCTRNTYLCSGPPSSEGLAGRLTVQLHPRHRSSRGKFGSQAGRSRSPGFSALGTSSKTPAAIRATFSDEARVAEPENAAEEPARQLGAEQDTTPVAKVTFQLKHQVNFGQQLSVAGSAPELGQWNVQAALPLVWTEGHVWKAEKAVGVGQTVEYKFVLTGDSGEVEWQPGENRIFETKNANDLTVSVPWIASGETVPEATADVPPEAVAAGFDNGVAPGTDAIEGIVASVGMLVDKVEETTSDLIPSPTEKLEETVEKNKDDREPSELPAVDAIVATAVAEASETTEEHSDGTAKLSPVEADESSRVSRARHEDIEDFSPKAELMNREQAAKVDETRVFYPKPSSSPISIVENDLQWILSRIFGPKSKRT